MCEIQTHPSPVASLWENECQGPAPFPVELAFPKKDGPAGRAVCPGTQQRPMPSANSSSNHPQILAFDGGHRELIS